MNIKYTTSKMSSEKNSFAKRGFLDCLFSIKKYKIQLFCCFFCYSASFAKLFCSKSIKPICLIAISFEISVGFFHLIQSYQCQKHSLETQVSFTLQCLFNFTGKNISRYRNYRHTKILATENKNTEEDWAKSFDQQNNAIAKRMCAKVSTKRVIITHCTIIR